MKQIRIQSDGTALDTVVTTESGEKLECQSITIWLEAREINRTDITFIGTPVDVHASVDTVALECPLCNHVDTHVCKA